jgi:hypothetical protein
MSNALERGVVNKFNRGEVAPEAFAREDVERLQNSCALMENFQPERLGPMRFRPGAELIQYQTVDDNVRMIPFNTDLQDPVMLLFEDNTANPRLKFMRQDSIIAGNVVTTGWQNDQFLTRFAAGEWVDADEGAVATSVISAGSLIQTGTGVEAAKAYQTSDTTDTGQSHYLQIEVSRGTVVFQVGENGVDSSDIFEATFEVGAHFIEFTPTSDFTVTISNETNVPSHVTLVRVLAFAVPIIIDVENALDVPTPSTPGTMDTLRKLRWAPSANVQYFCGDGWIPFRIRRHGTNSFSLERFVNKFGPYEDLNITSLTMNPLAPLDGDTEVETNRRYWDNIVEGGPGYSKGTLLKMAVTGQTQTVTGIAPNTATEGIFVFGAGDARKFKITINPTGVYTQVWLEKSFDQITWQRVQGYVNLTVTDLVYNDGLDGVEVYYRLILTLPGAVTAMTMTLSYDYGTLEAEGRIREVTGATGTKVQVQWYVALNEDQTVKDWYIGSWGGRNPFPSAVALYDGRLWFAGNNKVWGSESDFYESFDRRVEGGSRSIQKSIGFGSSKDILWLAPSARLVVGTELSEIDIRSDSFGATLTQDNVNLKEGSNRGCADVAPIVLDQEIIFVQRGSQKLLGVDFNIESEKHSIEDFNMLHPRLFGDAKIVALAYQTNPEMRIYCVLDDGTARVLLRDASEGILAWYRIFFSKGNYTADDTIKDVAILPGVDEDQVYFSMSDGGSVGSILKLAPSDAADGSAASKHFDRWVHYTSPGTVITLNSGQTGTLAVWADGEDRGDFVESGGTLNVGVAYTDVVVGYRYRAKYKSPKLGDYTSNSVLAENKRIINTALIMRDYVQGAVTIGPDEASMSAMPGVEKGTTAASDDDYDELPFEYDGESETDPRIHIHATGPANIQALVYEVKNTDRRARKKDG